MAANDDSICWICCCKFIFPSGLVALLIWVSIRSTKIPTASIEKFYVPALNKTGNYTANQTIYFHLKLANRMKDKGVNYGNISLNIFYGNRNSGVNIANFTVPAFYQGHKKKAHRYGFVNPQNLSWDDALKRVSANGSTANFSVELITRVKYKVVFWYTKRHEFNVSGVIPVINSGEKFNKKGIKLKSGAPDLVLHRSFRVEPVALLLTFLFLSL